MAYRHKVYEAMSLADRAAIDLLRAKEMPLGPEFLKAIEYAINLLESSLETLQEVQVAATSEEEQ
jgi:hypothetical protein